VLVSKTGADVPDICAAAAVAAACNSDTGAAVSTRCDEVVVGAAAADACEAVVCDGVGLASTLSVGNGCTTLVMPAAALGMLLLLLLLLLPFAGAGKAAPWYLPGVACGLML
jgi:hypothetical protein